MDKKRFSIKALAASLVIISTSGTAEEHRNVLLIMADDLRCELGYQGGQAISPHLDSLAAESVSFDKAYVQQAVCNPSRASMLTGLRPNTVGVTDNYTNFRDVMPEAETLPRWFKKHNYHTVNVGKVFHNWLHDPPGDRQSWSVPEVLAFGNHNYDRAVKPGEPEPEQSGERIPGISNLDVPDEAYYDGRVAQQAIGKLDGLPDKDPWFLAVGFWKPHSPFNAPKKYWDLYDARELDVDALPVGNPTRFTIPQKGTRESVSAATRVRTLHAYLATISYFDAQLGKLVAAMKAKGLWEDTIVVFVSDHGLHVGERNRFQKSTLFDLDTRVPLLIRAPGIGQPNSESKTFAELIDIFPTLNELCHLQHPGMLDGVSLVSALKDPDFVVKDSAYVQHPSGGTKSSAEDRSEAMGVGVVFDQGRYTEWRETQSNRVLAREFYPHDEGRREPMNEIEHEDHEAASSTGLEKLLEVFPR